ncbi:hypothetical protein BBJ28_00025247, partial [Nothophytophthora sp. Chile5]
SSEVVKQVRVAEAKMASLEARLEVKEEARVADLEARLEATAKCDGVLWVETAEIPAAGLKGPRKTKPPGPAGARNGEKACFWFRDRGWCKNGNSCEFAHVRVCKYYNADGGCWKGSKCEFVHESARATDTKPPLSTKPPTKPEDVIRAEAAEAALLKPLPNEPKSKKKDRNAELEARLKAKTPARAKKGICSFYRGRGGCKNGDACDFVHQVDPALLRRELAANPHDMEASIQKVEEEMKIKFAKAKTLDLVIMMDCTYSMDPWIEAAKTSIISIIQNVNVDHPNAKVRVGFVAYRDFCDGDKRLQVQPLTEEVDTVRDFISSLRAFGGGDGPEDIPGGLQKAIELDFQAEGKLIVLVADAPCHGSKFHNTRDNLVYKREILASPDICAQMRLIAQKGIDFTFIEVKPKDTAKMVAILESEYQSVKSADESERDFVKVSLDKSGDVVRFASIVCSSASSSLTASKSRSVLSSANMALGISTYHHYGPTGMPTAALDGIAEEDESEVSSSSSSVIAPVPEVKPLDWSEAQAAPEIAAVRHSFHFRPNEAIDWANLNLKHTMQQTTIRLLPTCFAKGAMRSAHALYDCKMEKCLVAKFYFGKAATKTSSSSSGFRLEDDVEMQIVAKQLATQFSLAPEVDDAVDFVFTCWYEIENPTAVGLDASMTKFTAEPYIDGKYEKYNNNNGWVAEKSLTLGDTAQAFSHFTWQSTYGQHMVVDLQGVGSVFTDPQIHSLQEAKFGKGNLSTAGMTAFFSTHKCNQVCRALDLKSLRESNDEAKDDEAEMKMVIPRQDGADPSMAISCPLCGTITTVLRSKFIHAHRKGRELYCSFCVTKVNKREPKACNVCKKDTLFSPFWYDMKGMEYPTTCKICKADKSKSG